MRLDLRIDLPLDRFSLIAEFTATHHVTGVFGESGSGKSSLLETVAGLRRKARGIVRFGETEWQNTASGTFVAPERRGIGYVPQDGLLFPHRNVRRNLLSGARRAGRAVDSIFDDAVSLLGLSLLLDRNVATLSGGERQRVALGRALCSGPQLLLMDEPLASLDLPMRRNVLPFLRNVRERFDVPMLIVSHDPIEVQALCDDLVVLKEGAVIARGAPRDVLTNPSVFALAKEEGFENILPCTLLSTADGTSIVRLDSPSRYLDSPSRYEVQLRNERENRGNERENRAEGVTLQTPRVEAAPGAPLLLSIPARDILLATGKPEGLSARNIVAGSVTRVSGVGTARLVHLRLAEDVPELAVEVTVRACDELNLVPGRAVYAVIKASVCTVFGA